MRGRSLCSAYEQEEHLRPIGNLRLLQDMVGQVSLQVVPSTMLARAAGRQWSVPRRCIGSKDRVVAMSGGRIRITVAGELVAVHDSPQGSRPINCTEEHCMEAISSEARFSDEDIREAARVNLDLLDSLGVDRR